MNITAYKQNRMKKQQKRIKKNDVKKTILK